MFQQKCDKIHKKKAVNSLFITTEVNKPKTVIFKNDIVMLCNAMAQNQIIIRI